MAQPQVPSSPPFEPDGGTGGAGEELTVRTAGLLVAVPAELDTTTRKLAPLSASVVAGVVYDAATAPAIGEPFLCHW